MKQHRCPACRKYVRLCECTPEQIAEGTAALRAERITAGTSTCPGCNARHERGVPPCIPILPDPPRRAPASPYPRRAPAKDPGPERQIAEMRAWVVAETAEARATRGTVDPHAAGYARALLAYEEHRQQLAHAERMQALRSTVDAPPPAPVDVDYSLLSTEELEQLAALLERARVR